MTHLQHKKNKNTDVKPTSANIPAVVHTPLTQKSKSSDDEYMFFETVSFGKKENLDIPQETLYQATLMAQSPQGSAGIPQETFYQSPQRSRSVPQDTPYQAPLVVQPPQGSAGITQETLYQSPQRSLSIPQGTLYQAHLVEQSPQGSEGVPQETLYQSPQRSASIPQETLNKVIPVRQTKPSKRRLTMGIKEREKIFGDLPPARNTVKSVPAKRNISRVAQPFVQKATLARKNGVKIKPFERRMTMGIKEKERALGISPPNENDIRKIWKNK